MDQTKEFNQKICYPQNLKMVSLKTKLGSSETTSWSSLLKC